MRWEMRELRKGGAPGRTSPALFAHMGERIRHPCHLASVTSAASVTSHDPFAPLQVENHDFAREDKAPQHVPPWARAEVGGP